MYEVFVGLFVFRTRSFFYARFCFCDSIAGRAISPAAGGAAARGGGSDSAGAVQGVDTHGGVLAVRGGQCGRFAHGAGPRGADAG